MSARELLGTLPLFACSGCGSEWVRSQGWTPIDADGRIPPEVQAERALGAPGSTGPLGVAGPADTVGIETTSGS